MGRRAVSALLRATPEFDAAGATDRDLLARFAAGDEAAFAALVARHGGMVLGVCRRVLPTVQDAEDACQATFLVLARKAAATGWQPSAANWLYATARRVAARTNRTAARRARREGRATAAEPVSPLDAMTGREAFAALDEELVRLPARYREPLVLCYLEGLTRDEAAARLGVPAATLKSQLERGRKQLADALTRRGVAPGAGLLLAAVASSAGAVSSRLTELVLDAARGVPSATAAALARSVAMTDVLSKAKLAVLAVGLVAAVGVGLGSGSAEPPPARKAEGPAAAAPAPTARDAGRIWFHDAAAKQLIGYGSDGTVAEKLALPADQTFRDTTPDGRRILYAATAPGAKSPTYHLRDFGPNTPGTDLGIALAPEQFVLWAPDGSRFVLGTQEDVRNIVGVRAPDRTHVLVDVAARRTSPILLPANRYIEAFTPDGKHFVLRNSGLRAKADFGKLSVFAVGGEEVPFEPTGGRTPYTYHSCRDGKTALVGAWGADGDDLWRGLCRLDFATGKQTVLIHEPGQNQTVGAESPDGRRLAMVWAFTKNPAADPDELRLTVADADGTNRQTFTLRDKAKREDPTGLTFLGWFPVRPPTASRLITEPGEYAFWNGRVTVQAERTATGTMYMVRFPRGGRSSGMGTAEPGVPRDAKWFIYPVSDTQVVCYKGGATASVIEFEEGVVPPQGGNRVSESDLFPGDQHKAERKALFAQLPKEVLDRLPAGFRGDAREPFQGAWRIVEATERGTPGDPAVLNKHPVTFAGDRWTMVYEGDKTMTWTTTVRPDTTPAEIDASFPKDVAGGKVIRGIYTFDGDRLTIALGLDKDSTRPTRFESVDGDRPTLRLVLKKRPPVELKKLPATKLRPGLTATTPDSTATERFTVCEAERLLIGFTLTNDGTAAAPFDPRETELVVNGQPLAAFREAFREGPVWEQVEPGRPYTAALGLGRHFTRPGVYRVQWRGAGFASAVREFRVVGE